MKSKLITDLKVARKNLISLVDRFPNNKREKILFDKWSLKDILVHLTGWANHQIETLIKLKAGKKVVIQNNLKDSINENLVFTKGNLSWKVVYNDFLETSNELISHYQNLPRNLWDKKIWEEKETTPRKYIEIEINHYKETHGPQIEKYLQQLTQKGKILSLAGSFHKDYLKNPIDIDNVRDIIDYSQA